MNGGWKTDAVTGLRVIEALCVGFFILGVMWQGADVLKLTLPQFLMLYGGVGAIISDLAARVLGRQQSGKFRRR